MDFFVKRNVFAEQNFLFFFRIKSMGCDAFCSSRIVIFLNSFPPVLNVFVFEKNDSKLVIKFRVNNFLHLQY